MPAPSRRLALLLLVCAALPVSAAAQRHLPVSFEAAVGAGAGTGGSYKDSEGASVDLLLGVRLREARGGSLIGALSAGIYGPGASSDVCIVEPDGTCRPDFPVLGAFGALAGVQRGGPSRAAVRFLAGPAFVQTEDEVRTGAAMARIDVDTPPFLHTSAVLSLRTLLLPDYRGETVAFTAFGMGLRVR